MVNVNKRIENSPIAINLFEKKHKKIKYFSNRKMSCSA
jgi:hypothetical protein